MSLQTSALLKPERFVNKITEAEIAALLDMLSYMRAAGSKTEKRFIRKFIVPLGAEPDRHGNYWLTIGQSQVLWSSHTDTVHREDGRQKVFIADGNIIYTRRSNCLGADCTTGVWLMRQMILAKVPGVYVFHRAEECGGLGSQAIAVYDANKLEDQRYAIAFDRKATSSVITHQFGSRCCSEAFVRSIAPMLPGTYKSDDGGTFTDTANYADIIPECSNISVGYYNQHTAKEYQNLTHAVLLAEHMIRFDESRLVAERDPTIRESFRYNGYKVRRDLTFSPAAMAISNGQ